MKGKYQRGVKRTPEKHWNYRILVSTYSDGTICFGIHEVYYSQGIPIGYSAQPTPVSAENMADLKWLTFQMNAALKKPILWADDKFPQEYKPQKNGENHTT